MKENNFRGKSLSRIFDAENADFCNLLTGNDTEAHLKADELAARRPSRSSAQIPGILKGMYNAIVAGLAEGERRGSRQV